MTDDEKLPSNLQKGAERIPPKYKIPSYKIRLFEKSEDILLFSKRSYRVSFLVVFMAIKTRAVNMVFDTGSERKFIWEHFLKAELLKTIQASNRHSLKSGTNREDTCLKIIMLHVETDYLSVKVVFGNVRSLAVPVLLGASSIDRFVKGILPPEGRFVS